jgi:hypothetical protein
MLSVLGLKPDQFHGPPHLFSGADFVVVIIAAIIPKGFEKVARDWSASVNPWERQINESILKGCEISFGCFLKLSHPFRMRIFFECFQGFTLRSNPGYFLSSPSGKRPQNPLASSIIFSGFSG